VTVERRTQARWEPPALTGIAVAGVAIAAYLTATHANAIPLFCSINSVVNCASVTHSAYSVIPGTSIPISSLGVAWFAVSGLLSLVGWRAAAVGGPEPGWLRPLHLVWATLALIFVLYLVYVEIVVLRKVCEWCTVVHLLVVATFVLALRRVQQAG
jgi:uncharacterized membrane protein